MNWQLAVVTVVNVATVIFTFGILYNRVTTHGERLERIEKVFDGIVNETIRKGVNGR